MKKLTAGSSSGLISAAVLGLLAGGLGGCNSMPPANGPTVGVRNDSDAPLRATFWVGDRNDQRPGARAQMSPQETMEIPAFGTKQFKLSAFSGFDSPGSSFVRVQVQPVGPSFQTQPQYWYELNPPSPYTLRVFGKKPELQFERNGGGTMVAVPNGLWFQNATALTSTPDNKPALRVVGAPAPVRTTATGQPVMTRSTGTAPLQSNTVARPARNQVTGVGEGGWIND